MPKYTLKRDERSTGGPKLSMCITANSYEEATADFEARWRRKVGNAEHGSRSAERLPVRTTAEIQAEAMTPEALAVKRNTRGVLK